MIKHVINCDKKQHVMQNLRLDAMHFTLDLSKPQQKLRNIIPDMEYDWCFNKKLATKGECQNSCKEKGDGWNLAVIPTQRHNQEVLTSYHLATSEIRIGA